MTFATVCRHPVPNWDTQVRGLCNKCYSGLAGKVRRNKRRAKQGKPAAWWLKGYTWPELEAAGRCLPRKVERAG